MSSPMERLSFLPDFPGRETLYHPLDANKDEIRVIVVVLSEDRSSAIHCILETISIRNGRSTVPYDAISYFWGSATTTEKVFVWDMPAGARRGCICEVPVTQSLAGALREFRARATQSKRPLILWTDAICIHQLDASERSQQVAIMQMVYKTATSVLAWLGEGDVAAEKGLINLFGLAKCTRLVTTDRDCSLDAFDYNDSSAEPDLESLARVEAIFSNFGKPGGFPKNCKDVREMGADMVAWVNTVSALLDLPYWYRGWTFQEACANDHVSLNYGQVRCRVNDWGLVKKVIRDEGDFMFWWLKTTALPAILDFYRWLSAAHFTSDLGVPPALKGFEPLTDPSLLSKEDVLSLLKIDMQTLARPSRRTTDPRDQVYSQIGCMRGLMLLNLKPDYASTTEQVFIATTLAILHTSRSWSHEQFFNPSESPFMPSWAIDFTLVPDHNAFVFQQAFELGSFSADSSASFRLRGSRLGSLLTAGFIHDLVVAVEPCDRLLPMQTFAEWYAFLLLNYPLPRKYPTNKDFFEGFCRTLCMGMVLKAKFGPQHAAACRDFGQRENDRGGDDWDSVFRQMRVMKQWAHETAMKFILTRNGHVGLAHRNVDVGDNIAIIATGDLPFIVRKVGKRENHRSAHIIVGACYVDGIMHGEAVRQRARRIYDSRERVGGVAFALWKLKNRKSITWDEKLDDLSFSNDLACDLAFSEDICLV